MPYTNVINGFSIGSNTVIDEKLVLTKEQMKTIHDDRFMPEKYFAFCSDDNSWYIYDDNAEVSETTGKYTKMSAESLVAGNFLKIEDGVITTTYTAGEHIIIDSEGKISVDLPDAGVLDVKVNDESVVDSEGIANIIIPEAKEYIAGENISISSEGVISALDTKYQAGNHVEITSEGVINVTIPESGIIDVVDSEGHSLVDSEGIAHIDAAVEPYDDTELRNLINSEGVIRAENDAALADLINSEGIKLAEEINRASSSENELKQEITSEGERAIAAEEDLDNRKQDKLTAGDNIEIIDNVIKALVPEKLSELENDVGFVTNLVNDLVNYYNKTEAYNKTEVNELIAAIKGTRFEIVTVLPPVGETNVIYLVPKSLTPGDIYEEYIYVGNAFEKIGSTAIDLSDYYTKEQVDGLLNQKQDLLVSGYNIKTINYESILGAGNININPEPEQYLKSANVSGDRLVITKKDNTIVEFEPQDRVQDVRVNGSSVLVNKVANIDLTNKQDKLIAGENIDITNNVIKAIIPEDVGKVKDVQISGTSIVVDGIANIPTATQAVAGVVKADISIGTRMETGAIGVVNAEDSNIVAKKGYRASGYGVISTANYDKAVVEGITNNSITLTEEEQQSAKDWLGITAGEEYDDTWIRPYVESAKEVAIDESVDLSKNWVISQNYLTEHQPLVDYAKINYVDESIETVENKLELKQDKLIAGSGITISSSNVISATGGAGGEYFAGTALDLDGNTFNVKYDPSNLKINASGELSVDSMDITAGDGIIINNETISIDRSNTPSINYCDNHYQSKLVAGSNILIEGNTISAIFSGIQTKIVNVLPTTGEVNTIYLLKVTGGYDTYMWVNNSWVKTGSTSIDLSNYYTKSQVASLLNEKQNVLVSGSNIKTINGQSLLGSGNISISGGISKWGEITGTLSNQTDLKNALDLKANLSDIPVIPDIPSKTSDLINDSGFITTSAVGKGNIKLMNKGTFIGYINVNETSDKTIDLNIPISPTYSYNSATNTLTITEV